MTRSDAERVLELEESAEGVDLFRPPGDELQLEKSRDQAEASGWIPTRDEPTPAGSPRLESARVRRDELRAAMQALETTVAGPAARVDWIEDVAAALDRLQRSLIDHIAVTDGPDGLLEEIVQIAPRLAYEAGELTAEHEVLTQSLKRVRQSIDESAGAAKVRRRVLALLARVAEHRQRGSDLVYEAYTVDIGAAG
jgi:hypothetical protein